MSVPEPFPKEIPEQTRQIVETWLDEKSLFAFLAQHVDEIISDEDFADLYAIAFQKRFWTKQQFQNHHWPSPSYPDKS